MSGQPLQRHGKTGSHNANTQCAAVLMQLTAAALMWATHTAELAVRVGDALQTDREADIASRHHVLDLEVGEARVEAQFLHDLCNFAARVSSIVLALHARQAQLARAKQQASRLGGLAQAHDRGREAARVVLRVAGVGSHVRQVWVTFEIDGGDAVPAESRHSEQHKKLA